LNFQARFGTLEKRLRTGYFRPVGLALVGIAPAAIALRGRTWHRSQNFGGKYLDKE